MEGGEGYLGRSELCLSLGVVSEEVEITGAPVRVERLLARMLDTRFGGKWLASFVNFVRE